MSLSHVMCVVSVTSIMDLMSCDVCDFYHVCHVYYSERHHRMAVCLICHLPVTTTAAG